MGGVSEVWTLNGIQRRPQPDRTRSFKAGISRLRPGCLHLTLPLGRRIAYRHSEIRSTY